MEPGDRQPTSTQAIPSDVVLASVATYSDRPQEFADFSANAVAGPFARFAALLQPGSRVLDAGCGPGRDLVRLTERGHKGIGIDLNMDFARMARTHASTVRGDLRRLPFAPRTFDAIWASASLIHLPPEDAALALRELARVARPGAQLCASVRIIGATGWAEDVPHGRRWFCIWSPAAFRSAVESAGFLVERETADEEWIDVGARASAH